MTWSTLFRDFIQPVLFIGLFAMTFVSMLVVLRNERREKSKKEKRIVHNRSPIDPSHAPPESWMSGVGHSHGNGTGDYFSVFN